MRLVFEESLRVFAPRTLHADDLLLNEDLGTAVFDVCDGDLRTSDRVHIVVVFEVGLQAGEAIVASVAGHGFDHNFAAESTGHHVQIDAFGVEHVLDVQAHQIK